MMYKPLLVIRKPIVLVGLMGAGKTTVGTRLAKSLNIKFFDTDQEIEKSASCSISDLFYYAGETYFRNIEKKVLNQLLEREPAVIATGGGAFLNEEVREHIKSKAISVWINATLPVLLDRVSRREIRPLLEHGNKEEILQKLIETRYPVYEKSDIMVSSDKGPHHMIVNEIIQKLVSFQAQEDRPVAVHSE